MDLSWEKISRDSAVWVTLLVDAILLDSDCHVRSSVCEVCVGVFGCGIADIAEVVDLGCLGHNDANVKVT